MRFKARIEYNVDQSKEAKLFGDKNICYAEVEFDFQDILGNSNSNILNSPNFTARNVIIPWLRAGNIPELISEEEIDV